MIARVSALLIGCITVLPLWSQNYAKFAQNPLPEWVDYRLPNEFHNGRREAVLEQLPENGALIIYSYPVRNISLDINYTYHPNPDVYYLTGIREPMTYVLLSDAGFLWEGESHTEVVFVREQDPKDAVWHGKRLGVEGARGEFELPMVLPIDKYAAFMKAQSWEDAVVFSNAEQLAVGGDKLNQRLIGDAGALLSTAGEVKPAREVMMPLRQIKTEEEVYMMRRVIDISCAGHQALMQEVRGIDSEYEAEAIAEFEFRKHGAEQPAYPSIVGMGPNTCVLHYDKNERKRTDNEFLLIDAGAEYRGYAADITRCYPIRGAFTTEQREIYNLVLKAQLAGIEAAQAGADFKNTHFATAKVIGEGLVEIGLIEKPEDYRKYFMHGTSHYLGLDVHDVGDNGKLQPGMVITVEPGIYISEDSDAPEAYHNIGVRIEDDILITKKGPVNLSDCVGKEIEEVELNLKKYNP